MLPVHQQIHHVMLVFALFLYAGTAQVGIIATSTYPPPNTLCPCLVPALVAVDYTGDPATPRGLVVRISTRNHTLAAIAEQVPPFLAPLKAAATPFPSIAMKRPEGSIFIASFWIFLNDNNHECNALSSGRDRPMPCSGCCLVGIGPIVLTVHEILRSLGYARDQAFVSSPRSWQDSGSTTALYCSCSAV